MRKNPHKGKFIVLEGLDGSGQSTQVERVTATLLKKGVRVFTTKEPTNDVVGLLIREILRLKKKVHPRTLQRLFVADREEHQQKVVIPHLKHGVNVISDRYAFSTVAFGSLAISRLDLLIWNEDFLMPDLTIILKVSPEICVERMRESRTELELFEEVEKLGKVWETYEWLAKKFGQNVVIVDGERDEEEITQEILDIIQARLGL